MDKKSRKEILNTYKDRVVTGGIYCIECSGNHRKWIRSTVDMEGSKNRFDFSITMKGSPEPAMLNECRKYGWESFSFNVLEELKKGKEQTNKEFADDIAALLEMWLDKSEDGGNN